MKRTLVLMVAALAVGSGPAAAVPLLFSADLTGAAEEPSNASPGTGFALVTIDDVAGTMRVEVTFADLLGTVTASHIHVINGPGDANALDTLGPVATTTPTFPGFPAGVMSGTYDHTFDMTQLSSYRAAWITDSGGTIAQAEAELFAGITSGRAYLNIHSSVFGGGEIRGFLTPVPEPSALILLAIGAALVARARRLTPRTR